MGKLLEKELKTFEGHRSELLGKHRGKFALVKEDKIEGVFDDEADALSQGYERFGNVPFLVKQIVEIDLPMNFTSNLIAV